MGILVIRLLIFVAESGPLSKSRVASGRIASRALTGSTTIVFCLITDISGTTISPSGPIESLGGIGLHIVCVICIARSRPFPVSGVLFGIRDSRHVLLAESAAFDEVCGELGGQRSRRGQSVIDAAVSALAAASPRGLPERRFTA